MYTLKNASVLCGSGKILLGGKHTREALKVPALVREYLEDWRISCNKGINHAIIEPG